MNGAQDLGGQHGFGPIEHDETGEPVFHHEWEKRAFAMTLAMGFLGQWNIDKSRHARESLPPAKYLSSSYYQIWTEGLIRLLLDAGLVVPGEVHIGHKEVTPRDLHRDPVHASEVSAILSKAGRRAAKFPKAEVRHWRQGDGDPHEPHPSYPPAPLPARLPGRNRAASWRACVSRHQRARARREPAAPLHRALCCPRCVGRTRQPQ
jgi:hypothetical protein